MTVGRTKVQGACHAKQVNDHSHVATGQTCCTQRPEHHCLSPKDRNAMIHRSTGAHSTGRSAVREKSATATASCVTLHQTHSNSPPTLQALRPAPCSAKPSNCSPTIGNINFYPSAMHVGYHLANFPPTLPAPFFVIFLMRGFLFFKY